MQDTRPLAPLATPVPTGLAPDGQHPRLWQKAALGLLVFTGPTAQGMPEVPGSRRAQRLMGTVKRGPAPSPWAGSEAEFYSVPQSFPVELDPSHPLRWPGLTGCLYPLCHLPARLPVPCALPSTAHTLGPLPRTWAQTLSISSLCQPVPPPAGHLALRRGTSAGISTPWLTEKRSERGHPGEQFPMRE